MNDKNILGDFYTLELPSYWDRKDNSIPIIYMAVDGVDRLDTLSQNCMHRAGLLTYNGICNSVYDYRTNLKFHEYFSDFLNPTSTELSLHYLEFGIEPEQLRTFLQEAYEMYNLLKEHLEKENNK